MLKQYIMLAILACVGHAKAEVKWAQHQLKGAELISSKVHFNSYFNKNVQLDRLLSVASPMSSASKKEIATILTAIRETPNIDAFIDADFLSKLEQGGMNLSLLECGLSTLAGGIQRGASIEISATLMQMSADSRMLVHESSFVSLSEHQSGLKTIMVVPNDVQPIIKELSVLHSVVELALSVKYPYIMAQTSPNRPDAAIEHITRACVRSYLHAHYGSSKGENYFQTFYPEQSSYASSSSIGNALEALAIIRQQEINYLKGIYAVLARSYEMSSDLSSMRVSLVARSSDSFYWQESKYNEFANLRYGMGLRNVSSNTSWTGAISQAVLTRGNPIISEMLGVSSINLANYYPLEKILVSESVYQVDKSSPYALKLTNSQRSEVGLFSPAYDLSHDKACKTAGVCTITDALIQVASSAKGAARSKDAVLSSVLHELTHAYSFIEYPYLMNKGLSDGTLTEREIGEGLAVAVQYNDWIEHRGGRAQCLNLLANRSASSKDICLAAFFEENGTTDIYQKYLKSMLSVFELTSASQTVYKIRIDKSKLDEEERLARLQHANYLDAYLRSLLEKIWSLMTTKQPVAKPEVKAEVPKVSTTKPKSNLCIWCKHKAREKMGNHICRDKNCDNYGNQVLAE